MRVQFLRSQGGTRLQKDTVELEVGGLGKKEEVLLLREQVVLQGVMCLKRVVQTETSVK